MLTNTGYQATEEDVANVLASHWDHVQGRDGKDADTLAAELFPLLDFEEIEKVALMGDDLDEQTGYANDEIASQLRARGVIQTS